jgi:hypothetical protein
MIKAKSILLNLLLIIIVVSCKNHYGNLDYNSFKNYRDSIPFKNIVFLKPLRLPLLTYKELPEYILIYTDSIEGLNNFKISKMMTSFCPLTIRDLTACEYIYRTTIIESNSKTTYQAFKIFDADEYIRQYVSYKDQNKDLIVWINSFCDPKKELSDYLFIRDVNDGGPCFFRVKINLTKMKLVWIMVNGYA